MNEQPNKQIAKALLLAQMAMGNATQKSSNPFFKSKYADLNAIREACMPHLNANGIVVLQPTITENGKNYVKTILLHESGESMECITEIIFSKLNDAQAQGSGITYARRYGLQSFVNIGADDDDGKKAIAPAKPTKPIFEEKNFEMASKANATPEQIRAKYILTPEMETKYKDYVSGN